MQYQKKDINEIIKDAFELEHQGQFKSAIELLYQGLNIEVDNVEILSQIADLYRKLKNYDIANEYALKALRQNKIADFATDVLFKIYVETNNLQEELIMIITIKI